MIRVKLLDYKKQLPILLGFIAMMLTFTAIFGLAFSSGKYTPQAYIVNQASHEDAELLIARVKESPLMTFTVLSYDEAVQKLENSKGIGAILIEDKEEFIQVGIISTKPSNDTVMLHNILRGQLSTLVNDIQLGDNIYDYLVSEGIDVQKKTLKQEVSSDINTLRNHKVYYETQASFIDGKNTSTGYNNLKHSLAGFTIFFSMFLAFFGIGSIVDEKVNFVWQRQLVSPISHLSILGGNLLVALLVGMINVFIMIYGGKYLFKMEWGSSDLGVILILAAFVFASTCLGLVISSLVKNMQQLSSITPVIVVSTSMLGGCMWPLEMIQSKVLLIIASFTPQKWAVEGIEKMIMYGRGFEVAILPICVLLGMGCVFLALGTYLVKLQR